MKLTSKFAAAAVALLLLPLAMTAQASVRDAVASYYGERFNGRLTANGERFNMNALTAAHKTLKFGTRVKVTNKANGRSVMVRINDRGPYIKGRAIDLSKRAAREIGMIHSGTARVRMEIIAGKGSSQQTKSARKAAPKAKPIVTASQQMVMDLF